MCSMLYIPSLGKIGEKGIDFEYGRQEEKLYVQAAYLLADKSSVRLEFGAYDNVKDNFPEYTCLRPLLPIRLVSSALCHNVK